MGRPKAVHTLATILARTDEVGDCLEWQGIMAASGTPLVKIHRRLLTVRRVIRDMQGRPAKEGNFLAPSCGNPRCVRPEHIVERTPRQHAKQMAALVDHQSPLRIARLQKVNAHKRALSAEDVAKVRSDSRSAAVVAHELGCSKTLVSSIRRGEAYRQISAAENPFAQLLRRSAA
jgi:hypothetical protein